MLARNILLAIGVLVLAAGVALSVVWLRQPAESGVTARVAPPQAILVAARPIAAGTLLRLEDMTWREVPATAVTGQSILRGTTPEASLVGAVMRRALDSQQALLLTDVVKPGEREFLVATLAPEHRAITVAIDAAQSASGLMQPGDRVDVVLTQTFPATPTGPGNPGRRSVGETVLRDLRIIALDQALGPVAKPLAPQPAVGGPELPTPKMITLEVTEQQAETLLVAEQLGKIQLILRGQRGNDTVPATATGTAADKDSPTWASDVSPALKGLDVTAPTGPGPGQGPIDVFHGPKIERRCPTSSGLVACP